MRVCDKARIEGAHASHGDGKENKGEGLLLVLLAHSENYPKKTKCRTKMGYAVENLNRLISKRKSLKCYLSGQSCRENIFPEKVDLKFSRVFVCLDVNLT